MPTGDKYASAMRSDSLRMFVGINEMAARYRVSRGTILRWVKETGFPIPAGEIDRHPAWHIEVVDQWWHDSGKARVGRPV